MTNKSSSLPIALILVAAFATAIGLWLSSQTFRATQHPLKLTSALLYPQPREIPDFQLIQADGSAYSKESWRGHWTLLFFGFTSCPDICPMTLDVFKKVSFEADKLGIGSQLRLDFISVDPERDSSERLKNYVNYFNPVFRSATGSHEELTRLTRSLGAVYSRTQNEKGEIQIDHSASAIIINPDAELIGLFRPPLVATSIVSDLQLLVGSVPTHQVTP